MSPKILHFPLFVTIIASALIGDLFWHACWPGMPLNFLACAYVYHVATYSGQQQPNPPFLATWLLCCYGWLVDGSPLATIASIYLLHISIAPLITTTGPGIPATMASSLLFLNSLWLFRSWCAGFLLPFGLVVWPFLVITSILFAIGTQGSRAQRW